MTRVESGKIKGPFLFDSDRLDALVEEQRRSYPAAAPFAHCVIDGLFPEPLLDRILEEFPGAGEIDWIRKNADTCKLKLATRDEAQLGETTRRFIQELNSSTFLRAVEKISGIEGLIPDPHLYGGGLHQTLKGGFLNVHADFNKHEKLNLDRRLNVLIYLNKDWPEEYGGHLELWGSTMERCEKRVLPIFNRMVIFSTTDSSFHGHPHPLSCPESVTRKSIALYYYTNGRPASEASPPHSTLYQSPRGETAPSVWKQRLSRLRKWALPPVGPPDKRSLLPLKGWEPPPAPVALIDRLTDQQLEELNGLLDFNCFTVDGQGRRFGLPAGENKRNTPQDIPDRRVALLDEVVGLKGKRVLEVGCFEGVHTIALAQRAGSVVALDSRVGNVVKTMVRAAFYEQHPRVMVYDLEKLKSPAPVWMEANVAFHVGVLYHMTDPVRHLKILCAGVSDAILLDTHVAREDQLNAEYEVDGRLWRCCRRKEAGYRAAFAGMGDHAKWLLEADIHGVLKEAGFAEIKSIETRDERHGKRILLIARRSSR